jgi:hypothetical protein
MKIPSLCPVTSDLLASVQNATACNFVISYEKRMLAGDRDLSPWTDIESQQTDFNEPMSDRTASVV